MPESVERRWPLPALEWADVAGGHVGREKEREGRGGVSGRVASRSGAWRGLERGQKALGVRGIVKRNATGLETVGFDGFLFVCMLRNADAGKNYERAVEKPSNRKIPS